MVSNDDVFSKLPDFFRKDVFFELLKNAEEGKNTQLIALKGLGKSLSLRLFVSNQEELKKRFNIKTDLLLYLSDLDLLPDNQPATAIRYIFGGMLGVEAIRNRDSAEIAYLIEDYLKMLKNENRRIVVILDSFDRLLGFEDKRVFDFLLGIFKRNFRVLSFVFSVDSEIDVESVRDYYGDFGRLLLDKKTYFPVFDDDESAWFFDSIVKEGKQTVLPTVKSKIIEASGGFPVCIKRLFEASFHNESLDKVIENPTLYMPLAYSMDSIMRQLSRESQTINHLVSKVKIDKDKSTIEVLKRYGILTEQGSFRSKVFENFLRMKFMNARPYEEIIGNLRVSAKLTSGEYKIVKYLNSKKGLVCTRDEIIDAVWGEKSINGIADHALDQIMSRLRKKLVNSGIEIETLRGRGHRLIS